MAGKQFSTKKYRLRSRAQKRRQALKIDAPNFGIKSSPEIKNLSVLRSIEAKVKAIMAS
ncbi:MAG: hypothetical protein NWR72_16265 [Bacteroidia bacterium]|nr:hypothetical protein [Bacteroidia bacterium]